MISSTRSSESASRSSWKFASSVISLSSIPSCSVSTSLTRSKTSSLDAAMSPLLRVGHQERADFNTYLGGNLLRSAGLLADGGGQPADDVVLDSPRRKANRVGDRAARGVAVRDHREAPQSQQVRAAVGVGIEALAHPARGRPDQEPTELPAGRGGDLRTKRVEQRLDRPLEELQADVAGEAVANDDVGGALEQLAALDVAAEPKLARLEQRVRLECEVVALLRLLSDRQEADVGLRDAEDLAREHGSHVRELEEVVGARVRVRARIDQHRRPASPGDRYGDRRPVYAANPAQLNEAGCEHRAGVPCRDDRVGAALPDEPARDHERALGLRADSLGRLLVHRDLVGRLDELESGAVETARADEDRLERRGARLECTCDDLLRRSVAAHGVDRDPHWTVYGAEVRSGSMSRPR